MHLKVKVCRILAKVDLHHFWYIYFLCSPLARLVFPAVDDNLLKYNYDDNMRVEPEWYVPIIPLVLANGADGIGTGWASRLPNYDVREIVTNIHRMLNGQEPLPMVSYRNQCLDVCLMLGCH